MNGPQTGFRCLYCGQPFDVKHEVVEHISTVHGDVTARRDVRWSMMDIGTHTPASQLRTLAPAKKNELPAKPPRHVALPLPTLPPLSASITTSGLSAQDFDPLVRYESTQICTQGYIDIPASYAVIDEHMFNACPRTILGYGNILRLATRYSYKDLHAKINIYRPVEVLTQSSVHQRVASAIKWAAGKERFPEIAKEVREWFDEQRRLAGVQTRQV